MKRFFNAAFRPLGVAVVFCGLFIGCASTPPLTSNINDFVMMGIKTNKKDSVSLRLVSNISDGEYPVLKQTGEPSSSKVKFMESTVLQKMIRDYMEAKFTNLSEAGAIVITVAINDFLFTSYTTEGAGMQTLRVLAGDVRDMPMVVSAKVTGTVEVTRNGKTETKNIIATAEDNYITGRSSNSGTEWADCVGSANNKVLMLLNAYFEEIKL
jgi:hypothetical protein